MIFFGARALDLHGRDGRDGGDPQPGWPALAGDPPTEIGRGTATFDGLSIAWAAVEHLHAENRLPAACFAPISTNLTAAVGETSAAPQRHHEGQGMARRDVVFLHEVGPRGRPTAPTASRWRGSPAFPTPWWRGHVRCWTCSNRPNARIRPNRLIDDLPLFAVPVNSGTGEGRKGGRPHRTPISPLSIPTT